MYDARRLFHWRRIMFRMQRFVPAILGLVVVVSVSIGQTATDLDVNAKIREEGVDRSQILKTMHFLTDIYGPRLTGSPNHENAARWAVNQMESWGMVNGHSSLSTSGARDG
jgi:hypothetical protein